MLSRSNSKCPIVGFDVRFPTGELNMNPELHLPLLVIIFIERATWCESSSSYSSLTYMPFPAKKRIKGAHPGLTLFVAKLQTTYKINGTTEYSFLPGWWEVSCQWTRRRIRDKKTIIYGFHNWQLCSLTFFFSVQSGKLLKEGNISMKSNLVKRERIIFAFYRITEASHSH